MSNNGWESFESSGRQFKDIKFERLLKDVLEKYFNAYGLYNIEFIHMQEEANKIRNEFYKQRLNKWLEVSHHFGCTVNDTVDFLRINNTNCNAKLKLIREFIKILQNRYIQITGDPNKEEESEFLINAIIELSNILT